MFPFVNLSVQLTSTDVKEPNLGAKVLEIVQKIILVLKNKTRIKPSFSSVSWICTKNKSKWAKRECQ